MKIEFADRPPVGVGLSIEGQVYRSVAHAEFLTRAGEPCLAVTWQSHCWDCGAPFEQSTAARRFPANRRCEIHRNASKRVDKKAGPAPIQVSVS